MELNVELKHSELSDINTKRQNDLCEKFCKRFFKAWQKAAGLVHQLNSEKKTVLYISFCRLILLVPGVGSPLW